MSMLPRTIINLHDENRLKNEGNNAIPNLLFVNSGGVIIDDPYIPLNKIMNQTIDRIDKFLSIFNRIFPLHTYACLIKE